MWCGVVCGVSDAPMFIAAVHFVRLVLFANFQNNLILPEKDSFRKQLFKSPFTLLWGPTIVIITELWAESWNGKKMESLVQHGLSWN